MNNSKDNLALIQARMGSSRLPGKVLMDLMGKTVLERVIERVKCSKLVDEIVVVTTIEKQDLEIVKLCSTIGVRVYCGSEIDVLDRYYQAAKLLKPQNVLRITADCPLIDPHVIDKVLEMHLNLNNDYTSNTLEITYPDGLDVEVMRYDVLEETWKKAILASQREHVTQYIVKCPEFKKGSFINEFDYSAERWTLDTIEDYIFISRIYNELYEKNREFSWLKIIEFLKKNPDVMKINQNSSRNEGLFQSINHDYIMKDYVED